MSLPTPRHGAFLDRDGTLIEDAHYIADPSRVRALPGVVEALRRLNARQLPLVIVTNQSGIAQQLVTEAQYQAVKRRVEALFAEEGTPIAGSWHCPHYPSVSGPCDCRKPMTGMYREAARRLGLTLERSFFVGDRRRDVEPGLALGGYAILVPSADTPEADVIWAEGHAEVADSLGEAVHRYLAWFDSATHPG